MKRFVQLENCVFLLFFKTLIVRNENEREKSYQMHPRILLIILILCSSLVCISSIGICLSARNLTGSHCACWRHPKLTFLSFPTRLALEIFLRRSPLLRVTLTWGLISPYGGRAGEGVWLGAPHWGSCVGDSCVTVQLELSLTSPSEWRGCDDAMLMRTTH